MSNVTYIENYIYVLHGHWYATGLKLWVRWISRIENPFKRGRWFNLKLLNSISLKNWMKFSNPTRIFPLSDTSMNQQYSIARLHLVQNRNRNFIYFNPIHLDLHSIFTYFFIATSSNTVKKHINSITNWVWFFSPLDCTPWLLNETDWHEETCCRQQLVDVIIDFWVDVSLACHKPQKGAEKYKKS